MLRPLIIEVPRYAHVHDAAVGGIVGREEVVLGARTTIDVTVCNEETCTLQVHIGIDVDPRIATEFHMTVGILLDGKLAELGYVVGSVIIGEVGETTAQFDTQYAGNLELQEQVRPKV